MKGVLWASLKKELREALRDKRTLILTVLMPLVFYPAMVGVNVWMQHNHMRKSQERMVRVAVMGELNLPVEDKIEWRKVEQTHAEDVLKTGEYDVVLEVRPNQRMLLHHHSGESGHVPLRRLERALEGYKQILVRQALQDASVDPVVLEPFTTQVVDHASMRQQKGGEIGGMAAYFLVFLAFTGCMSVAVDTAAGEKERGTLEAMLATPASFAAVAAGKLIYVALMGCLSVLSTFLGILLLAFIWGKLVSVGEVVQSEGTGLLEGFTVSAVMGLCVLVLALVMLFATGLFGVSILARSVKEAHMRAVLLMLLVAMSLIYSTLPGVKADGWVMWVPVLNVAMSLRGIWEGTLSDGVYWQVIGLTIGLALLVLWSFSRSVRRNPEKALLKQ